MSAPGWKQTLTVQATGQVRSLATQQLQTQQKRPLGHCRLGQSGGVPPHSAPNQAYDQELVEPMKGMVAQEEQHFAAIEFTYLVSICRSPLQTVTL